MGGPYTEWARLRLTDDNAGARVLATSALAVGRKLERAGARETAGLAARLAELVRELGVFTAEPDEIDVLKQRVALRRAGIA